MYLIDTTDRLRKLEANGTVRTIAGGLARVTRIWPRADGSVLAAPRVIVQANGEITTPPQEFRWPEFAMPDGRLLYLVRSTNNSLLPIEQSFPGTPVFANFTGPPVAVTFEGDLLVHQSTGLESTLVRFRSGVSTPISSIPLRFAQYPQILWNEAVNSFSLRVVCLNCQAQPSSWTKGRRWLRDRMDLFSR